MAPAKSNTTKATIAPVAKKATKKAVPAKTANKKAETPSVKRVVRVAQRKAYTRPQFRRPHTYRKPKTDKPGTNKSATSSWDEFRVVKSPLVTDMTMKKIEENNTLTFLCDPRANKTQIKRSIYALYKVKTVKVNTLIRPDGAKKAYVRLAAAYDAMDVATKIGVM